MATYGPYIWSCYALTLIGLVWIGWSARSSWRQALQHARRRAQSVEARDA